VITGVRPGEEIALASPDQKEQKAQKGGASSAAGGVPK
jgi:hypothetical protein